MKYLLIFIGVVALMPSCSNPYKTEINTIDSLIVKLEEAKIQLNQLDTGKIYFRIKQNENDLKFIFDHTKQLSKESAIEIDTYNNLKGTYSKMLKRLYVLYEEVETIPVQLKNLKSDLSKNLIPKEKAKKFLTAEYMAAESVISGIEIIAQAMEELDQSFPASREKILHLIQTMDTTTTVP